jgi:hypothetical protein
VPAPPDGNLTCHHFATRFGGGNTPTDSRHAQPRTLGQFELIEQLGIGHFRSVWKAADTTRDRFVAIATFRATQLGRRGKFESPEVLNRRSQDRDNLGKQLAGVLR